MTSPLQQKLKIRGPSVVTANRLTDGAVVYRTAEQGWTRDLNAAALVANAQEAGALLEAADHDGLRAVEVYIAPVATNADGRIESANLRERIRQSGPTIAYLPPGAEG